MLVTDLIREAVRRTPQALALRYKTEDMSYEELWTAVETMGRGFLHCGLTRGARVGIYLPKQIETVIAMFGAAAAGGAYVPVNPGLKARQVGHILRDCNVRILVTSADRLAMLSDTLRDCPDLTHVVLVGQMVEPGREPRVLGWEEVFALGAVSPRRPHPVIDGDVAAILYTSGSTGMPKGVVLSHRNIVAGAESVSEYLGNTSDDRILAVLPLSFDYGMSQLTTAFRTGAAVVLLNHLLPRDVVKAVADHQITGLACVPPLWIQLANLDWPEAARNSIRYFTNSGGRMPRPVLDALRARMPKAQPFLMYGLTEAFRSTYLPPDQVDLRPDSIGKAIPNAEILVVRPDGTPCDSDEPGELVHRGAHVALGYWNDEARTAERFRPLPGQDSALKIPEMVVWSGDTVRRDAEGFLYFIGRRDEMIKTSGYRVSPTEIEESLYASGLVGEAVAVGVDHPDLGQAVAVLVVAAPGVSLAADALLAWCRREMPAYMVPARIDIRDSLPRNPNGKLDRKALADEIAAGPASERENSARENSVGENSAGGNAA